jgi:hypothetical protein
MGNEFEQIDDNGIPAQEFGGIKNSEDDGGSLISSGNAGEIYNWKNAPAGTKAPPRINLDGKEVEIIKMQIILPSADKPWLKTRKGDKEYKPVIFELTYSIGGQKDFFSGMRVFNREGKYSHPTITRDRMNQASNLLGIYSDFKKKDINEVSLKEFLSFLDSKPKAVIKSEEITNPVTKEKVRKNLIEKFV